ncbi:MAG: hypothetical protein QGH37_32855, partial [Candidatus Poribacteria bacterium]|nr:hypothetical protein [Candidatus Poribacteria bacterium]
KTYTLIEGHTLSFALRTFTDAIACIYGLMIVPKDKLLEDFFDMKSWFMKIKKAYFFITVLNLFVREIYFVLGFIYTEMLTTEQIIGGSVFMVIMILLNLVSAFSKNDYYLSFHGTLVVVINSIQLSAL